MNINMVLDRNNQHNRQVSAWFIVLEQRDMNEGDIDISIFHDLKTAFVTIDHATLQRKLYA